MKNMSLPVAVGAALAAFAGIASAQTYGDVAKVVSATPVYERFSAPRRDCRVEQVQSYEERRSVVPGREVVREPEPGIGPGTILGAIVGGVIGHQFGHSSHGRDVGTGVGAVIGGLVGNAAEREANAYERAADTVVVDRVPVTRDVQRCTDVRESVEKVVAYDVVYEYNGRQFRARLGYDPGPEMPVNVDVRPPASSRAPLGGPRPPVYRGPY